MRYLPLILLIPTLLSGQQSPQRVTVTPELERTAFADSTARMVLLRARAARLIQDSALRAYDATTIQRMSIWMGMSVGPKKLLLRSEQSAHVQWARGSGVWVEPTGRRSAFSLGGAQMDLSETTPIPFYPGRETLWIPFSDMGVAKAEVSETEFRHPLASGAEAYYRYATGDSLTVRLGDGTSLTIRELRITARRPDWRLFVGSFWFDVGSGALVRAAYRLSAKLDVWQAGMEDEQQQLDSLLQLARSDTGAAAVKARREYEKQKGGLAEKVMAKIAEGTFRPLKATMSSVTVEYALYEGRFWLPTLNVAEGQGDVTILRIPITWEERFRYASVNGPGVVPIIPSAGRLDSLPYNGSGDIIIGGSGSSGKPDTSAATRAREDSTIARYRKRADSLRVAAAAQKDTAPAARLKDLTDRADYYEGLSRQIEQRRTACAKDSTYYAGTVKRYDGALRMAVRMPCDESKLDHSPDLPGTINDPGEQLFDSAARDQLLAALDFSLQPGWGPQRPVFVTGLNFVRFNRIEGLSVGGSATSALGLGYTVDATARYGFSDHIPNAELGITRSNGRVDYRLGGFSRLNVANDDWGSPLSMRSSISNLMFGHDEGFYYRAGGVDLSRTTADASLRWRVFGERQRSAGVLPNSGLHPKQFGDNIDAVPLTAFGVGGELSHAFGGMTTRTRLSTRLRAEGAFTDRRDSVGTAGYGRYMFDATLTFRLWQFPITLSGAAGTSTGTLPIQRAFFVGGAQTVRGQLTQLVGPGRVGDTFWLTRNEIGWGNAAGKLTLFSDIGWAGARADVGRPGRPLSGVGAGFSLLDGMIRLEFSRGLWPDKIWRTNFYLTPRF